MSKSSGKNSKQRLIASSCLFVFSVLVFLFWDDLSDRGESRLMAILGGSFLWVVWEIFREVKTRSGRSP